MKRSQIGPGLIDIFGGRSRHAHVEADAGHRAHRPGMFAAAYLLFLPGRRPRRAFLLYGRKDRRRLVWWCFLRFSEVFRGAIDIFSGNGLYYSIRASCGGGGPYMVLPKEDGAYAAF